MRRRNLRRGADAAADDADTKGEESTPRPGVVVDDLGDGDGSYSRSRSRSDSLDSAGSNDSSPESDAHRAVGPRPLLSERWVGSLGSHDASLTPPGDDAPGDDAPMTRRRSRAMQEGVPADEQPRSSRRRELLAAITARWWEPDYVDPPEPTAHGTRAKKARRKRASAKQHSGSGGGSSSGGSGGGGGGGGGARGDDAPLSVTFSSEPPEEIVLPTYDTKHQRRMQRRRERSGSGAGGSGGGGGPKRGGKRGAGGARGVDHDDRGGSGPSGSPDTDDAQRGPQVRAIELTDAQRRRIALLERGIVGPARPWSRCDKALAWTIAVCIVVLCGSQYLDMDSYRPVHVPKGDFFARERAGRVPASSSRGPDPVITITSPRPGEQASSELITMQFHTKNFDPPHDGTLALRINDAFHALPDTFAGGNLQLRALEPGPTRIAVLVLDAPQPTEDAQIKASKAVDFTIVP